MSFKFGNYWFFLWMLYFLCSVPQQSHQSVHQRNLFNELFETYSVLERPVHADHEKIVLTISLTLMQILKLDIHQQVLSTNMWMTLSWNDVNLRWDPKKYGNLSEIRVSSQNIWTPDILLYNYADDGFDGRYRATNVLVTKDGNCSNVTPGIFKSTCKIDMTWFPFDEQKCEMKFSSWTYNGNEIDLRLGSGEDISAFENEEWEVISFDAKRNEHYYPCCTEPYVDVTYLLHMKRRSVHHLYHIIILSALVAICGSLVFVLPPDSASKLTVGIVALALLYIFQYSFSHFRTPTSVSLIDRYFSCTFILILLSLVSSVLILSVHYRTSKMPKCIRSLFVERLPRYFLIGKYHKGIIHKSPTSQVLKEELNYIGYTDAPENEFLTQLRKISDKFQRDELIDEMKNDWKLVAMVLDRLLLFIFATFFLIVTIRVWTSY